MGIRQAQIAPVLQSSHVGVVHAQSFLYPHLSSWRSQRQDMVVTLHEDDKVRCFRFHPHLLASGHFTLTPEQVQHIVQRCRSYLFFPLDVLVLPQVGSVRCEIHCLPDNGWQLVRYNRQRQVATTFRIFAADIASFLEFLRVSLGDEQRSVHE